MMRIGKWLVLLLVCVLSVLSVLSMTGATLAQSAVSNSPGAEPALSLRRLSMTFLSLNGKFDQSLGRDFKLVGNG